MGTRNTLGQLCKQWNHNTLKLIRIDHIKYFFQFVQEHDFFWTIDFWPIAQEARDNLYIRYGV